MIRPALIPWPAVAWIDLLNRVVDGIDDLSARGYLVDPDPPHEWAADPGEAVLELAVLAAGCSLCRTGPSALAEHWLNDQRGKWEQQQPTWTCRCGAVFKPVRMWGDDREEFYTITPDGLLDVKIGEIRRDPKGKIRHSDPCLRCGALFAATIAARTVPEGALF